MDFCALQDLIITVTFKKQTQRLCFISMVLQESGLGLNITLLAFESNIPLLSGDNHHRYSLFNDGW